MHIVPTQAATEQLLHRFPTSRPTFKLIYDTEGCGCAVNGVAQLWRIADLAAGDVIGYDEDIRIVYREQQEVFFEDQLKLDYNPVGRTFILKSNNQMYHSSIPILDKIGGSQV